jgi:hypothetical protein
MTAPRWMHDHCIVEWPRCETGWCLQIESIHPHFDHQDRHVAHRLDFVDGHYPPMLVPVSAGVIPPATAGWWVVMSNPPTPRESTKWFQAERPK